MTAPLTVLDLFSGIGGFSLGLERTGQFQTVAFCEVDPFCKRVLASHWPGVPILDDITKVEDFPAADIVVGGFPCQDVSQAGKRAGLSGERSGLYRELVRAVRMVQPRHAIVENLAALLSDGMGDVLGDLAESGACVEWDCVPASAVGAPHQRDRVWIVRHAPDASDKYDGGCDRSQAARQEPQSRISAVAVDTPHPESIGRGPGRTRRPPDSFARVRDATRKDTADTDRAGLAQREGEQTHARPQLSAAERATCVDVWQQSWPREPALLGMDDGVSDRVDRTRALGNTVVPSIVTLIAQGILAGEDAP